MARDVSILIVTYQCGAEARNCLASIYEHTDGVDFEVVVLDNASRDGTAEMVRSEFPQARLLALDENVGFAAGVNRAAEEAEGEYLFLLNPDTVVHEGAVANLVDFARRHPEHGLYGGRTLRSERHGRPRLVLGAALALEPRLLRDHAQRGLQGHARVRPGVARRLAARLGSRGRCRHGLPAARPDAALARSSAASTCASSCTARTPTSRSARAGGA